MRITDEQKRNIYSLVCERLSANEDNLRYVEDFINYKNESLADTLKNEAFEEDEKGNIAYYLIKNPDGKILFYFSLKCGSLYESIKGVDSLERIRELYEYVIELKNEPDLNESDRQAVESIIERIRTGKGLIKNDLAKISYAKKGEIIKELEKASEELANKEFDSTAGGGAVYVKVSGNKEIKEIKIKKDVVDPEDVEMLQDLILTCANEALRKVDSAQAESLGKYNIPGMM